MQAPSHSRFEPRAARYLELLVEFGHLTPEQAEQVLMMSAETWAGSDRVPLSFVRRIASTLVVDGEVPQPGGKDVLSADWSLLFH